MRLRTTALLVGALLVGPSFAGAALGWRSIATQERAGQETAPRPIELTGHVRLPRGTPDHETVEVIAEVRPSDRRWAALERRGLLQEVARARVANDGVFSLSLPAGTAPAYVRLDLRGSVLYLKRPLVLESFDEPLTLVAELGARIEVRLVPPLDTRFDATRMVGSSLFVGWDFNAEYGEPGSGPFRELTIDVEWRVHATALSPNRFYSLVGQPAPFAPFGIYDLRLFPGEVRRIEVPLLDGITVSGRVLGEEGKPVDFARISVTSAVEIGERVIHPKTALTTDEKGAFAREGMFANLETLQVQSKGYLRYSASCDELGLGPDFTDLEVVLSRGSSIEGVARLPDGRPVHGVYVRCTPLDENGKILPGGNREPTDENGRFVVTGLLERTHYVRAEVRLDPKTRLSGAELGHHPAKRWDWVTWRAGRDDVPADIKDLELVLVEPPGLKGTVLGPQLHPITFFTVTSRLDEENPGAREPWWPREDSHSFRSTNGEFDWADFPSGNWYLDIEAPGYLSIAPIRVEVPGTKQPVRFAMMKGTTRDR